jgi:hypothetical protein
VSRQGFGEAHSRSSPGFLPISGASPAAASGWKQHAAEFFTDDKSSGYEDCGLADFFRDVEDNLAPAACARAQLLGRLAAA